MGKLTNGILVGLGISLLIAPKTGKEMRQLVVERVGYIRGIPPENEELKQQVQQMAGRVQDVQQQANRAAEMGSTVQDYAQQTASSVNSVQRDLKNVAKQAGTDVPSTQSGSTKPTQPIPPKRPTS
jgi:gas vesicle protein